MADGQYHAVKITVLCGQPYPPGRGQGSSPSPVDGNIMPGVVRFVKPHRLSIGDSCLLAAKLKCMTLEELEREYSELRQQSESVRSYL